MTATASFEATLHVIVEHHSGRPAPSPAHVIGWTCADPSYFYGGTGWFDVEVCPLHTYTECPDECEETSIYRIRVVGADV